MTQQIPPNRPEAVPVSTNKRQSNGRPETRSARQIWTWQLALVNGAPCAFEVVIVAVWANPHPRGFGGAEPRLARGFPRAVDDFGANHAGPGIEQRCCYCSGSSLEPLEYAAQIRGIPRRMRVW